jgi:hypothetical protein
MHSIVSLLLALDTHAWFFPTLGGLLFLGAGIAGTASGMPLPPLEGMAIYAALLEFPDELVHASADQQYFGGLFLLCWVISCLVMLIRFFMKGWLAWHGPSFLQLIAETIICFLEMPRRWRESRKKPSNSAMKPGAQ